jgi:hypothetical protein
MMKLPAAFAGLEDVTDLGYGSRVDTGPTLLRVLTDLYLQRPTHTLEDEHYYTELVLRLIDAADVSERAALAARLARYPSAPAPVLERLARDVVAVAAPILAQSPCLGRADTEAIAEERGGAAAEIIATRAAAAPPAPEAPSPADAANTQARELSELFYAARPPERRLILINLEYASIVPSQPLSAIQRTDVWRLESAALQHNTETLIRELRRTLGISRAQARRIVNDELGEPTVVAARAMNLSADVLQRVLLFMNPWAGQSIDRVYELAKLHGEISVDAARRMIAIWRNAEPAETGQDHHEQVHRDQAHHEAVNRHAAPDNARRALPEVLRRPEPQQDSRLRSSQR